MLLEKASRNPLVDGIADILPQFLRASLVPDGRSLNSLEEELIE